jgi:hypothetical protein
MMTDGSADLDRNYQVLKNEMLNSGVVTSVTKASAPATEMTAAVGVDNWPGKLPGESLVTSVVVVNDRDYFNTLRMQIPRGRNFIGNNDADANCVILNDAAAKQMRLTDPINQSIAFWGHNQRVIGTVNDAVVTSPFAPAQPTLYVFYPEFRNPSNILYRISPTAKTQDAISALAPIFKRHNPAHPYQYRFADEEYAAKFNVEILIGKLAVLFAILTIFISCLGLFGLAAYMAEQRTKEIGIRKVLGASILQVWALLSKDFIGLIIISCIIASPIAFYFLQHWLLKYDYRISIGGEAFIASGLMAIGITLLTISFQTIKAAIANPAKSLKTD